MYLRDMETDLNKIMMSDRSHGRMTAGEWLQTQPEA